MSYLVRLVKLLLLVRLFQLVSAHFFHIWTSKKAHNLSFWHFWLGNVLRATTACTFSTSQFPKVVREWRALYHFTWKCASHHNAIHFFDISTSQSGPNLVFYAFSVGNVLCATTASTFSTSQLLKVLRSWGALYILTWKRASRHSGGEFFMSHLNTWLRTRRFSEPTFRPSRATKHWRNRLNHDFPTFSCTCIFFLRSLSLLSASHCLSSPLWLFPPLLFHASILSEVWLLNFLR